MAETLAATSGWRTMSCIFIWPKEVDVEFELWIEKGAYVEREYVGGKLTYHKYLQEEELGK